MYSVQCAVYRVEYIVQRKVKNTKYLLKLPLKCTVKSVQFTFCPVSYFLQLPVQCLVCGGHCTLYTKQCIVFNLPFVLLSVQLLVHIKVYSLH